MSVDLRKRLSYLSIPGVKDAADSIEDGELDLAMGEASQLTVTLLDPTGVIINSAGAALKRTMAWAGLKFTIATIEHGPVSGVRMTTLTGRTKGWQDLKARKGRKTWRGLSPSNVVRSECKAVGLAAVTQKTAVSNSISRLAEGVDSKSTSDLDLFDRLAAEQGFVYGEVNGVFYFGAPSWLVKQRGWTVDGTADYIIDYPTMSKTLDNEDEPGRVSFAVPGDDPGRVLLPFAPVQLTGVPGKFKGRYLIDRVTIPLGLAAPATVELVTPVDPEKQK